MNDLIEMEFVGRGTPPERLRGRHGGVYSRVAHEQSNPVSHPVLPAFSRSLSLPAGLATSGLCPVPSSSSCRGGIGNGSGTPQPRWLWPLFLKTNELHGFSIDPSCFEVDFICFLVVFFVAIFSQSHFQKRLELERPYRFSCRCILGISRCMNNSWWGFPVYFCCFFIYFLRGKHVADIVHYLSMQCVWN